MVFKLGVECLHHKVCPFITIVCMVSHWLFFVVVVVVFGFQIGVYDLPIDLLREPPDYLRVREVKEWFVEYLVDMLGEEESDHEDLTAPLLVIVSCNKAEFRPRHMQKYTYEVSSTTFYLWH